MKQLRRQDGLVSLTMTIIIGILFIIIVVSMIKLMIKVQREATDSDQSTRAYYAAESAVEESLLSLEKKLKDGSLTEADFNNTCQTQASPSSDAFYTCRRITHTTNHPESFVPVDDDPYQIDLGAVRFKSLRLSWHNADDDNAITRPDGSRGSGAGTTSYSFTPGNNTATWGSKDAWNYPGVPELTTIRYPINQPTFTADKLTLEANIIKPATSSSATNYMSSPQFIDGNCGTNVAGGGYNCFVDLNGFDDSGAFAHVIRLKSRYRGAHFRLTFYDGSGNEVAVPDQFATIDVTARAGDVYRRIIYQLKLQTNAANLDYAIFSDTDICKNFSVAQGNASGCPFN